MNWIQRVLRQGITAQEQPFVQPAMSRSQAGAISQDLINTIAGMLGVPANHMAAVIQVESGGAAFRNGRLVVRFEPHVFWNEWGKRYAEIFAGNFRFTNGQPSWHGANHQMNHDGQWGPVHLSQDTEWSALEKAMLMDHDAALRSISMGAPQIMGFNHRRVGFESVSEMFETFKLSPAVQMFAFAAFIVRTPGCLASLRASNWRQFAVHYNGPAQADHYANLIRQRLER